MANFLSDIANEPARAPRFGGVIARRAKIQLPTGFTAGDTLQMFTLPKGAVVLDGVVFLDDPGTTLTIDVGYLGGTINGVAQDPDAYGAALAASAGGRVEMTVGAGFIDVNALDAERPIAITAATAAGITVGADVVCVMQYVLSA